MKLKNNITNFVGGGMCMNYIIKRVSENKVIMEMENGIKVTITFRACENPDIENIVTDNLMTSYERRMKECNL